MCNCDLRMRNYILQIKLSEFFLLLQIVFVDDLNMFMLEQFGVQFSIELLRQWLDYWNWYDLKEITFMKLIDIQVMVVMGLLGGGRNFVISRFLRYFNMIIINEFDDDFMIIIFRKIMDWYILLR